MVVSVEGYFCPRLFSRMQGLVDVLSLPLSTVPDLPGIAPLGPGAKPLWYRPERHLTRPRELRERGMPSTLLSSHARHMGQAS